MRYEIDVRRPLQWLATTVVATGIALAQTPPGTLARNLAATCTTCHGAGGDVPRLTGRSKDDIVRAMHEFKEGTRPSTVMQQLAKGFTDEQIDRVAAWLAAQTSVR